MFLNLNYANRLFNTIHIMGALTLYRPYGITWPINNCDLCHSNFQACFGGLTSAERTFDVVPQFYIDNTFMIWTWCVCVWWFHEINIVVSRILHWTLHDALWIHLWWSIIIFTVIKTRCLHTFFVRIVDGLLTH